MTTLTRIEQATGTELVAGREWEDSGRYRSVSQHMKQAPTPPSPSVTPSSCGWWRSGTSGRRRPPTGTSRRAS